MHGVQCEPPLLMAFLVGLRSLEATNYYMHVVGTVAIFL
jgi:hypothetical protein